MDPIGFIFFILIGLLIAAAVIIPQIEQRRNQGK